MAMVKKQLNDHNSGVKVLDDRRVNSLKNRLQSYKGQIYDASRTLSDEVCCGFCVLLLFFSLGGFGTEKKLSPHHLYSLSNIHVQLALCFCQKEIEAELDKHAEL